MFFNSPEEVLEIIKGVGCAVFVVPKNVEISIKNAVVVEPEGKRTISIEQIRAVIDRLNMKQISDQYVIVRPADAMTAEAANAFLKNLEEPKEKVHFLLVTDSPSKLLPTILSRAFIYFLKDTHNINAIDADEEVKKIAKKIITAKPEDLIDITESIAKKKDEARIYALNVLSVAIEMLYKSYFLTKKEAFLKKIPGFLAAYENIEKNGHIKLHLVADLL